ncbi:MAG TPA: phosphatidylglycerol lysyltransferase domain-containing protein [Clostridia bacterium]|jgi:hypothetical protein|nr:phosphatidylglycerol lysyltransferase domain-containing protein [Clostridia bacterium]
MANKGEPLTKKHGDLIYDFLQSGIYNETVFSKTNLFAWPDISDMCIHIDDDFLIISYDCKRNKRVTMSPLVKKKEDFIKGVSCLESQGIKFLVYVNEWQAEILKERGYEVEVWESRSEYLYSPEDLITLKGKEFYSRRRTINKFKYNYEYRPYNGTNEDRQGVIDLFELNKKNREIKQKESGIKGEKMEFIEDYYSELEIVAINKILDDYGYFNVQANVLLIDGKIQGFVAGEVLPNGIGGMYFQKGNKEYRGIYSLIDNLFCKGYFNTEEIRYINRQEDLGIPGLRKSKLKHMVAMANLYTALAPDGIYCDCPEYENNKKNNIK